MVGLRILIPPIKVRILVPELTLLFATLSLSTLTYPLKDDTALLSSG
jgi:hypothetical protein